LDNTSSSTYASLQKIMV